LAAVLPNIAPHPKLQQTARTISATLAEHTSPEILNRSAEEVGIPFTYWIDFDGND